MFKSIECKLGNMRKVVRWVICPVSTASDNEVYIQSERRIAKIDLNTKKAILSKSTEQNYFHALSPCLGASVVDVPDSIINELSSQEIPKRTFLI